MGDQWSKHLAEKGYTGISLPSREFKLLTLVYEYHGARGHDNAFDYLAPSVRAHLPAPDLDYDLPAISGERTRSVDLSIGLKILSGLISALGGGTLGLNAGFKSAKKLTFSYDGISSETISPVPLQAELNRCPAPASGLLRDWLGDHLYVVTSVLKATKITVTAHDQHGTEVGLDVPVISGAVGANLGVKASGTADSTVTFEGTRAVPFAVRLFQVVTMKSSGMLTLKTVKEGDVIVKAVMAKKDSDLGLPVMPPIEVEDEPTAVVEVWDPESEAGLVAADEDAE